jgi:hypothetical protein
VQQQEREQRSLLRPAEGYAVAVLERFERAEDSELDARLLPPLGAL